MISDNGYVSLDMARRLKEAGVEIKTAKVWAEGKEWFVTDHDTLSEYFAYHNYIPAPSVGELWEWLPPGAEMHKGKTYTVVYHNDYNRGPVFSNANPADALGELALLLAERGK